VPAAELPVARVAVDSGLAHLDRPFDYAVPQAASDDAQPGVRVRVRFAGRQVDGWLLERAETSEHAGRLTPLKVVSAEPVLSPEIAALARAVADRTAGTLADVLRLALPPRHARVEAQPPREPAVPPPPPEPGGWSRYPTGPALVEALAAGRSPRAVWTALPGPDWPAELAVAVQACLASGRGALVVVPDGRDVDRAAAALTDAGVDAVALQAGLGPAERYRRWLAVRRGAVRAVVGTRAAAFAPVHDLGLVVVWDDGDDLHVEPRSPYAHVRDVLVLRAHLTGAAAIVGGHVRTAEGQLLLETRWARAVAAERATVRGRRPGRRRRRRRPARPRSAGPCGPPAVGSLRRGAGVTDGRRAGARPGASARVVPEPRLRGRPTPVRCPVCAGPLAAGPAGTVPACRWCGHLAADWQCPTCEGRRWRAVVVGARRTAEELGRAFPGVTVRTSGRDDVLAAVPAAPALVVATPGAEPVADGGYGAVLLLDTWALLGRADLRAGEEALRRWTAAAALARSAGDGGRVVVVGDRGLRQVQALVRWDPAGFAETELAERAALGFPPAVRTASVTGTAAAVAEVEAAVRTEAVDGLDVLGPVTAGEDVERLLLRVPRARSKALAVLLKGVVATRSARKAEPVRVEVDPQQLA
jgi:primosomal protein N' (replication factor Y)